MSEPTAHELILAANQAMDLKNDPAFQRAVLTLRADAIDALIGVDATDTETIRTRQAEIKAIDGLCQQLADAINRAPRKPQAVA